MLSSPAARDGACKQAGPAAGAAAPPTATANNNPPSEFSPARIDWTLLSPAAKASFEQGLEKRVLLLENGFVSLARQAAAGFDLADSPAWQTGDHTEAWATNIQALLFTDLLIVGEATAENKIKALVPPVQLQSIVLAPEAVTELVENGERMVKFVSGDHIHTLLAADAEQSAKWRHTITEASADLLRISAVSTKRRGSVEVVMQTTKFERADTRLNILNSLPEMDAETEKVLNDLDELLEESFTGEEMVRGGSSTSLLRRRALRKGSKDLLEPERTSLSPDDAAKSSPDPEPVMYSSGEEQMVLQVVRGELLMMAGTRTKLIEYLTSTHVRGILCQAPKRGRFSTISQRKVGTNSLVAKTSDEEFVETFLLCYRTIMKPGELMAEIQQRFILPDIDVAFEKLDLTDPEQRAELQQKNHSTRLRVLGVVLSWVQTQWQDFALDPSLLQDLENLLKIVAEAGHNQFVETCQAAVASQQKAWDKMLAEEDASKAPVRERSGPLASIMLHMNAAELAKQLTLFDASLFRRILPVEYLNHLGKNEGAKDGSSFSRHLDRLISRFDEESFWVAAEVTEQEGTKAQASMIAKFIEVAQLCLRLRNAFSIFAILGALDFPQVRKLKDAWDLVPKKLLKVKKKLEDTIMDPSHNMKNYRDFIRSIPDDEPVLPFLPIALKDMYFLNEGNDDNVESLINFDKFRMISKYIKDMYTRLNMSFFEDTADKGFQAYLAIACTKK